jgi:hypothetical protein
MIDDPQNQNQNNNNDKRGGNWPDLPGDDGVVFFAFADLPVSFNKRGIILLVILTTGVIIT